MVQSELENLSFMYTNAEDYAKVKRRAADLYKEHEKELLEVILVLLSENGRQTSNRSVGRLSTCCRIICAFLRSKTVKIKM